MVSWGFVMNENERYLMDLELILSKVFWKYKIIKLNIANK